MVALDPLADRLDLIGRNALAEVFAAEPPLQDVVGTLANGFAAAGGLEELLAQVAAAKAVDGAHLLEDLLAALVPGGEVGVHVGIVYVLYNMTRKKKENLNELQSLQFRDSFDLHPVGKLNSHFPQIPAVNPGVKRQVGGVAVRILSHPAIVMFGRVQRLSGISDKMSHGAHEIGNILLRIGNFLRRAARFKGAQTGEIGLQFRCIR